MIGYITVGTNDLDRAKGFYDSLFGVIGATRMMDHDTICAWGTDYSKPMFGAIKPHDGGPATVGNGMMIALLQDSRANVDALYAKAMALGGKDEGAPGVRGEEGDQAYYGAYFRDLDGNKLVAFRVGPAD